MLFNCFAFNNMLVLIYFLYYMYGYVISNSYFF